jgi:hypothetical protein
MRRCQKSVALCGRGRSQRATPAAVGDGCRRWPGRRRPVCGRCVASGRAASGTARALPKSLLERRLQPLRTQAALRPRAKTASDGSRGSFGCALSGYRAHVSSARIDESPRLIALETATLTIEMASAARLIWPKGSTHLGRTGRRAGSNTSPAGRALPAFAGPITTLPGVGTAA